MSDNVSIGFIAEKPLPARTHSPSRIEMRHWAAIYCEKFLNPRIGEFEIMHCQTVVIC